MEVEADSREENSPAEENPFTEITETEIAEPITPMLLSGVYDSNEFKNWLLATGKTKNTVNTYMAALRKILREAGKEFQEFADDIERLRPLYLQNGSKAEMGKLYSGSGRNVVNSLASYVLASRNSLSNKKAPVLNRD